MESRALGFHLVVREIGPEDPREEQPRPVQGGHVARGQVGADHGVREGAGGLEVVPLLLLGVV